MELKCLKCGYEWKSVSGTGTPKQCPRCKRYDWGTTKITVIERVKKRS